LKPWKRAYDFTKSNPNTLLFSTTKLPLRSEEFKWIGPLYPQQNHAYKLKGRSDIVVNDTQDLKRYTLGLLEYDANHQILASKGLTEDNFRFVVNYEQVLRILLEGRVDLVFHNVYSLKHELQRRPDISMDDLESVYVVPRELQFYIAANKATDDKIITALQASLDALVAEGLRDEIINKYFPGKGRDISF
jgi:polar amino acid transport system substrate-binding protein